jgi:ectoine hydroxylase-related dioxygenase (phytanoyl-CoA dioxygenase family)
MVVAVADAILLPHAVTYQISSVNAIELLPGQTPQALHRDDSPFPISIAGMELMIGVMWALDDFTAANGATRIVPGSHRYIRSWHIPPLNNWEQAIMPKGSALFYLGSTWHGSGANSSDRSRLGLITTYIVGWLRQEENQYLYNPPEIAAKFSPRLRALLGYTRHGAGEDLLGSYRGDNPAWVPEPPEASWRVNRGQVATAEEAKAQVGS